MRIGNLDSSKQVLIIAEIGNNHEGDFGLAKELVGLAAESKVDIVKFQTFVPSEYVRRSDVDRFARLSKFALTIEQFHELHVLANKLGLVFLSTPFDLSSATALNNFVPAFKIGSGENTFYPLLERVSSFGKPIIMSCGVTETADIRYAQALIERIWASQDRSADFAVLHCVSSYPTPPAQANLLAISKLKGLLGCEVGYSDHTLGIDASVLAVAVGATIIEKHFTISHDYSDFRDHALSATPAEMKELVTRVREASVMLGDGVKSVGEIEKPMTIAMRRSIVAKNDLPVGHVISFDDLSWVRPAGGLPPGSESRVLGRSLKSFIKAGEPISLEALS
jgi:N,N'-diacetyllegionaminate synthase